jgi:outer membrane lipoprotein SlyB
MNLRTLSIVAVSGLLLAGCYTTPPYAVYDSPPVYGYGTYGTYGTYPRGPVLTERVEYGVVEAIDWYRDGQSTPTGLGAIVGGVAGGVLGHQIGSGRGNTAATIAGAIGGALVGNQIERSHPRDRYRIVVRLDNGAALSFSEVGEGELRVGDRVRVVNGRVYRA